MTKKQFLFWLIQTILVTFLGGLRFIEPTSGKPETILRTFSVFISNNRLGIAVVLVFTIAAMAGWKELLSPRKKAMELRQKIMDALLEELLSGDRNNYRISIFRKATLFRRFRIYGKQAGDCYRCWRKGEKPIFLRGKYVYVRERLGTEHPNSRTFFYYSPDTIKKCQGVAGAVMQGLSVIVVPDLPDIEGINLVSIDLKNKKSLFTRRVRDYMSRGYVSDIQTLRRIHKKSRHIYGNILNNAKGPEGVLVIDSFLEESFLNDSVITRLGYYATIIGATM